MFESKSFIFLMHYVVVFFLFVSFFPINITYATYFPQWNDFTWYRVFNKHSEVFLNKFNRICWSPLLFPISDCISYFLTTKRSSFKINSRLLHSHSSFRVLHQQDANVHICMFCFKKVYSFALSCSQFPLEDGKFHLTYEGDTCQN